MTGHEHENQRHEDRGREAREPETDSYPIRAFRKAGANLNTVMALLILAATGPGGVKAWAVGSSINESDKIHAEQAAKHEQSIAGLARTQNNVSSKVDTMTSLFTQVLTSQGKLEAQQVTLAKSQDELRVEITRLEASGMDVKVHDLETIIRQHGESLAEIKALLRERAGK